MTDAAKIQELRQRFLAKQLYLIRTVPVVPRAEIEKMLPQHLERQLQLERDGILFAAGPIAEEDGSSAGGMIIIRAESFAAARAIADADPFHKAGLRRYTLQQWRLNEGSYSLRVRLSDQTVTIE